MVIKIQKSHKSMKGTLEYNQKKADKDTARILAAINMDSGSETYRDFERTFERYERGRARTDFTHISFQMSINPNPEEPGERLRDPEVIAFTEKLMEGLGYGKQPFLIYEHHDIDRVHYHVVSIRVNERGHKIKDSFEERRLQKLMERLSKQFHYSIGNEPAKKKERKAPTAKVQFVNDTPRFNPKSGDIKEQYRQLFEEALHYQFTTPTQFQAIMRGMGVEVKMVEGKEYYMIFQGLDTRGDKSNGRVPSLDMPGEYYSIYLDRMQENKVVRPIPEEEKKRKLEDRRRVGRTLAFLLQHAKTQKHFEKMLEKQGINILLSRTVTGEVFGITVVDRQSRTAYKGSDLVFKGLEPGKGFEPDLLKQKAAPGGEWEVQQNRMLEEWKTALRLQRQRGESAEEGDVPETRQEFLDEEPNYFAEVLQGLDAMLLTEFGKSRSRYIAPKQPKQLKRRI